MEKREVSGILNWISFQFGDGKRYVNLRQVSETFITEDRICISFGMGKNDTLTIRKEEDERCYGKIAGFFSDLNKFPVYEL